MQQTAENLDVGAAKAAPLLNINNIEVIYDHVILVLKGVSLELHKGGIVALLGANGAGKTTTLKAISNLLRAERGEVTKGSIEAMGERIDNMTPNELVKRGIIQVMEGRHCFEHLTVEENLLTGAYTRTDGRAAVAESLEKVYHYFPRLKERRTAQAGYTSGGEQQMTAIGRGLMANPAVILLDEPFAGVDPISVIDIQRIIQHLAQRSIGVLITDHNVRETLGICGRAYILNEGGLMASGNPDEILSNQNVREVYLGEGFSL